MRETKNPLLLHPLSRESEFLKRIGGNQRDRAEGEIERFPVRKKIEKVLGGNRKGITFAVRFREENR